MSGIMRHSVRYVTEGIATRNNVREKKCIHIFVCSLFSIYKIKI